MTKSRESSFTASDVKAATGMSYRELNKWDKRGALPNSRQSEARWRKFSPKAIFVLMVCSELRKQFNVPLESLKWLKTFMMEEGANHLAAAAEMMSVGFNVLLLTDFKTAFEMSPDRDVADLLNLGLIRDESPGAFVILKVNPLVNRLLGCLKEPVQFRISEDLYGELRRIGRRVIVQSNDELSILKLLRSGDYSKVVIQLAHGEIVRTDVESEHGALSSAAIINLIEESEFQTVSLTTQSGKVVRVTQSKPNVMSRRRTLRETPERRSPVGNQ